jgi:hypothetical protein
VKWVGMVFDESVWEQYKDNKYLEGHYLVYDFFRDNSLTNMMPSNHITSIPDKILSFKRNGTELPFFDDYLFQVSKTFSKKIDWVSAAFLIESHIFMFENYVLQNNSLVEIYRTKFPQQHVKNLRFDSPQHFQLDDRQKDHIYSKMKLVKNSLNLDTPAI